VKNLSELLSQSPDVVDITGARPIPILTYRYGHSVQRPDEFKSTQLVHFLTELDGTKSLCRGKNKKKSPRAVEKCNNRGCEEDIRPDWKFCASCGAAVLVHHDSDDDFVSLKSMSGSTADRFDKIRF
jgi:hypothetical protein